MKNANEKLTLEDVTISNASVDESVLTRPHYVLADFTDSDGYMYAINLNNKYAYPIIGKRKNEKLGMVNTHLTMRDLFDNIAKKIAIDAAVTYASKAAAAAAITTSNRNERIAAWDTAYDKAWGSAYDRAYNASIKKQIKKINSI